MATLCDLGGCQSRRGPVGIFHRLAVSSMPQTCFPSVHRLPVQQHGALPALRATSQGSRGSGRQAYPKPLLTKEGWQKLSSWRHGAETCCPQTRLPLPRAQNHRAPLPHQRGSRRGRVKTAVLACCGRPGAGTARVLQLQVRSVPSNWPPASALSGGLQMFPGASAFRCPPASPDGMTEGLQSRPCPGQPGGLAPETGGDQVGVWRPTGWSPWNGSGPRGGSQKSKGVRKGRRQEQGVQGSAVSVRWGPPQAEAPLGRRS